MRIVSVALLVLVLVVIMASVDVWQVRANEYFGDGQMYAMQNDNGIVALISAWGWYVVYGTLEDCRIIPLWSPVGDAMTVECGIVLNDKGTMFRGWMDFRGHPRPFCGGLVGKGYPEKCFGEY